MFTIHRPSKCLQWTFTQNPGKLPFNPEKCPGKRKKKKKAQSVQCVPSGCLLPAPRLAFCKGNGGPAATKCLCLWSLWHFQWGPLFRKSTVIFHYSHKSENCKRQRGLGHFGGSWLKFKKERERERERLREKHVIYSGRSREVGEMLWIVFWKIQLSSANRANI